MCTSVKQKKYTWLIILFYFYLLLFFFIFPGWNYMLDNCPLPPAPHFLIYYIEVEILVKLLSIMDHLFEVFRSPIVLYMIC